MCSKTHNQLNKSFKDPRAVAIRKLFPKMDTESSPWAAVIMHIQTFKEQEVSFKKH